MTRLLRILFFTCLYTGICSAQPSAISLFEQDSLPNIIVTTDIRQLIKSKYSEAEQPATLYIIHDEGDTSAYSIELRCRGNMRKETCYFPSTRMKFDKKDFTYNKLKWVNVCGDAGDEEFLLKEHLAYELYRLVTEMSFKTRLVRIEYRDVDGREKPLNTYALVIQNADELAAQFGGRIHEPTILKESLLNSEQLAIFSFFQYMIGNTDWAFGNRHNVEVFTHPETNTLVPVAYDFDYSGFVNTSYAVPHESMPITHVTMRHNKSVCIDEALAEKTRLLFLEKKEVILTYCNDFSFLTNRDRSRIVKYLEDFYKIMEDPKDVMRIFSKDCRRIN